MDKINRLKEIVEAYEKFEEEIESRGINFGQTDDGGFWLPTRWDHIIPFLEGYATKKNIIQPPGPIVDAGSGDCRVSAVLDVYGFNPIINIELDGRLVDASSLVIDDLVKRGIVDGDIRTVNGDFTTSKAYDEARVSFNTIPYFYHGINHGSMEKLAEKISKESPEGTKLIIYGMFLKDEDKPKIPLQLECSFRTRDNLSDFLVYKK